MDFGCFWHTAAASTSTSSYGNNAAGSICEKIKDVGHHGCVGLRCGCC